MTKTSKFETPFLLAKVRDLKEQGFNIPEIARRLGKSQISLATLVHRHGISGWPKGAAARDQRGAKNPNYKGGSRATYGRTSKNSLIRAGRNLFTCEKCGKMNSIELPRHHIDRNKNNNSPDNLWVLCVSCHNREHIGERQRDSLGRLK